MSALTLEQTVNISPFVPDLSYFILNAIKIIDDMAYVNRDWYKIQQ